MDPMSEEKSPDRRVIPQDVTIVLPQKCDVIDLMENLQRACTHDLVIEKDPNPVSEQKSYRNWLDLPRDVTASILQKLDALEILKNVQKVCTQWESICMEPAMWTTINLDCSDCNNLNLWKDAVDRGGDALTDLRIRQLDRTHQIEFFTFLSQRCTKIRRLVLVRCFLSNDGFCEASKRLPLLEDLEFSDCFQYLTARELYKVGASCPLLKSLKINRTPSSLMGVALAAAFDHEAMAISKKFQGLRHLQLSWNPMTNKGLEYILNRCPQLESLDLSQCFKIDLKNSSLLKRCAKTIKEFRNTLDERTAQLFHVNVENVLNNPF